LLKPPSPAAFFKFILRRGRRREPAKMNDHDLLETYEPVLRFAKSERFFPMAVEHYLERCSILPSGPLGAAGLLFHLNETACNVYRQTRRRTIFFALHQ
jgi:hypothetical protein